VSGQPPGWSMDLPSNARGLDPTPAKPNDGQSVRAGPTLPRARRRSWILVHPGFIAPRREPGMCPHERLVGLRPLDHVGLHEELSTGYEHPSDLAEETRRQE
jgi:hypothetical protein